MLRKILSFAVLFCGLRVITLSQLLVTSSGAVNLGSFIKGGSYSVDPLFNEITYTITAMDSIECERTVILYNNNSDFGNESDIKLTAEWTVDINTPFINGGEYKFKHYLKVKVRVKNLYVSQNASSGNKREFLPRLTVEEIKY